MQDSHDLITQRIPQYIMCAHTCKHALLHFTERMDIFEHCIVLKHAANMAKQTIKQNGSRLPKPHNVNNASLLL